MKSKAIVRHLRLKYPIANGQRPYHLCTPTFKKHMKRNLRAEISYWRGKISFQEWRDRTQDHE